MPESTALVPFRAKSPSVVPERRRERPILFSGPMVRRILAGSKTQTRRVVRGTALDWLEPGMFTPEYVAHPENYLSPYGFAGDRLWVRETCLLWTMNSVVMMGVPDPVIYADDPDYETMRAANPLMRAAHLDRGAPLFQWKCTPSIHMPRWASRITLEVTHVRIERLLDMTQDDACAEGITVLPLQSKDDPSAWYESAPGENQSQTPRGSFAKLWNQINGERAPWSSNPWVWVVGFRRLPEGLE